MTASKDSAHVVSATVHRDAWPIVWYGLISIKARLQSVEATWAFRVTTMAVDDEHVEVGVETLWKSTGELGVWAELGEIERFFDAVRPPVRDIRTQIRQVMT